MVDNSWWLSLTCQPSTKPRNAKSTLRLATAHTVRGVSSSMALRTSQCNRQAKPLSLRKTRARLSAWPPCSSHPQVPATRRPSRGSSSRKWRRCFRRLALSTSLLLLLHASKESSLPVRKARSLRAQRHKSNRSQESLTARCLSTTLMSACKSIRRSCSCTTKSLLKRTRSRAKLTSVSISPHNSSTWTFTLRPRKD